ncbi:MAG TPA: hypothetical protein VL993_14575 [Stellaceae bacterium]|nr:hypothetical protein [Stellaceae bacterium]
MTDLAEAMEFLDIAGEKGFVNENTVSARRTACNKFFDILEPGDKTVEYVRGNLDVVKARFANLNKDVRGNTVDEYARRVQIVLNDFTEWKTDRAGWERKVSSRQSARPTGDGDKVVRIKADKAKTQNGASQTGAGNPDTRVVTFPIRPDFELQVTLPRNGITVQELKKLVYFLIPYATDWEPSESPRNVFPMLEREDQRA